MFVVLLVGLLVAAAVHIALLRSTSPQRIGEIVLLYVLVGYCGVPMLVISVWLLVNPVRVAEWFGLSAGGPFQAFFGWAYLGMSVLALLAVWYRRTYVIGPALLWAVFFAGATAVHLQDVSSRGTLTHHGALAIVASHGLISVLLLGSLVLSGVWKART